MSPSQPTRGQVERTLAQEIQVLYRNLTGQSPARVTSHLFGQKLVVFLQNTLPPVGQLLKTTGRSAFVEQLELEVHTALKPNLKSLVERVLGVPVISLVMTSDLDCDFSCLAVLLQDAPIVRQNRSREFADASNANPVRDTAQQSSN